MSIDNYNFNRYFYYETNNENIRDYGYLLAINNMHYAMASEVEKCT